MKRHLDSALALTLTAALCALVWGIFALPVMEWKRDQLRHETRQHTENLKLHRRLLTLRAEKDSLAQGGDAGVLWSARQHTDAAIQVQSRMAEIAQEQGLSLKSATPTEDVSLPQETSVAFRIEFAAPLDAALGFVVALENNDPPLIIDTASLRRAQALDTASEQPSVLVQMTLAAAVRLTEEEALR